jgi:hypothetical protein
MANARGCGSTEMRWLGFEPKSDDLPRFARELRLIGFKSPRILLTRMFATTKSSLTGLGFGEVRWPGFEPGL